MYAIINNEGYIYKGYVLTSLDKDRENLKLPLIFETKKEAEDTFRQFRFKTANGDDIIALNVKKSPIVSSDGKKYAL